jgi:hypothetical protein
MPEAHSISSPRSNQARPYSGEASGAFAKSISLHKTTMIYTHVLNQGPKGVRSPMDEV